MKFVATAAVLATLALGAPAGEARVTRAELPKPCRVDGGDEIFVLACDPDRRADQIHLRVGATEATPTDEPGVGRLRSDEPLQPGETVSLRWRHPSAHAVLSVRAMAPDRPRRVILDLRGRPASVDVTAQADGSLRVTTPTGSVTVPTPASLDVPWEPRSARAAATQLLGAVDHLEGSLRARATLCAALDPTVLPYYQLLFLDPERYPCFSALTFFVFGDENVPIVTSTVHHGSALVVRGGRAILRTTLTHRYIPNSTSDPRRLDVRTRVLLVRDAQGIWRLATVDPLLPLVAVSHRKPFTDAELARAYRRDLALGRKAAAGDPPGDVVVQEGTGLARDQAAHAGVDLAGAALAGRCLAIRSAGPLPERFTVALHDASFERELEVAVAGGRVVVLDTTNEDDPPKPLPGAAAHLDPDGLVVSLPVALTGTISMTLGEERSDVSYGDEARVRSG